MKEKLIKLKNEFFHGKNYEVEKVNNEIKELEELINNFYFLTNTHMSIYKVILSTYKCDLLSYKLFECIKNYKKNILKGHKKQLIYSLIKNISLLILNIISKGSLSIILLPISIYITYETLVNSFRTLRVAKDMSYKSQRDNEKLYKLSVNLNNCENMIKNSYEKVRIDEETKEDDITDIEYSNALILYIMEVDEDINEVLSTIPDNIKELTKKTLQEDLKTKEESLEKLLTIVKENRTKIIQEHVEYTKTLKKTK